MNMARDLTIIGSNDEHRLGAEGEQGRLWLHQHQIQHQLGEGRAPLRTGWFGGVSSNSVRLCYFLVCFKCLLSFQLEHVLY